MMLLLKQELSAMMLNCNAPVAVSLHTFGLSCETLSYCLWLLPPSRSLQRREIILLFSSLSFHLASSKLKMSAVISERSYAPAVPSPLNPASCRMSRLRNSRRGSRIINRAHKPPVTLSPTQRLLRQKAAAAWKSETLLAVRAPEPEPDHPDQDIHNTRTRTGFDETREEIQTHSNEERPSIDLENGTGLPIQDSHPGEKGPLDADYWVDMTGVSGYLTLGPSAMGDIPRQLSSGPPAWRVLLVICLASIFGLLPALQRQSIL